LGDGGQNWLFAGAANDQQLHGWILEQPAADLTVTIGRPLFCGPAGRRQHRDKLGTVVESAPAAPLGRARLSIRKRRQWEFCRTRRRDAHRRKEREILVDDVCRRGRGSHVSVRRERRNWIA